MNPFTSSRDQIQFKDDSMNIIQVTNFKCVDMAKLLLVEVKKHSKWKDKFIRVRKWEYTQVKSF